MTNFLVDYFGETLGPALGLVILLAVAGAVIWLVMRAVRRMGTGLFVSGSKGRAPRLAVTDAVPVDSHRRLILVRRDSVEHLIMIGGPADIVVETGIGATPPAATAQPVQTSQPAPRPAAEAARNAVLEAERGRPVRQPQPAQAASAQAPAMPAAAAAQVPAAQIPAAQAPAAQPPAAQMPAAPIPAVQAAAVPAAAPSAPAPAPAIPAPAAVEAPAPVAEPRPPVAPPVFPAAAAAPDVPARVEPSFGMDAQGAASSAASKASAELDRILAEIELARSPQR